MSYQKLEQDILTRLAPLTSLGFEVEAMPETQDAMRRPFPRGRVTVAYRSSMFNENGVDGPPRHFSTSAVVQKETADLEIVIAARVLRGATGIYGLCGLVRKYLVGFMPSSWGRIFLKEFEYIEHADGVWTYSLTVSTTSMVVQHDNDLDAIAGVPAGTLITSITIDQNDLTVAEATNGVTNIAESRMHFIAGAAIGFSVELTDDGAPLDLTGYTFRFAVKQFASDDVTLILKACTFTGNIVTVLVPSNENTLIAGKYVAILEMVSPANIENEITFPLIIDPQLV